MTTRTFVAEKVGPELMELITKYRPEVLWSDGDWEADPGYWDTLQFLAWLYSDSPVRDTVVTNDRWGVGVLCKHGDFYTCSDRYNPGILQSHKWENAMTIDKYVCNMDPLLNIAKQCLIPFFAERAGATGGTWPWRTCSQSRSC